MSDVAANTILDNHKGMLQEYCHMRNLGDPSYVVTRHGTPNEPSWHVEVNYGQSSHATPEALHGSKRLAEQIAAKQVLEIIKLSQEAFLAGQSLDKNAMPVENPSDATELAQSESRTRSLQPQAEDLIPIEAPIELITSALSAASQRLAGASLSSSRFRKSLDSKGNNQVFAHDLANLTMLIVREVLNAAEATNVKFPPFKPGDASR